MSILIANQDKKPSQSKHFPCDKSFDGVTRQNFHNALFCKTKIPEKKIIFISYFTDLCWQPSLQPRGATRLILISCEPTKDWKFPLF